MNKLLNTIQITILLSILCPLLLFAQQKEPEWDNTTKTKWNATFEKVSIPSTMDGHLQKAFLYKSTSKTPQPLIVCLHTWSGDYSQKDPITPEILARNWNYIRPNFRGPNRTPEAMGSQLVLSDIEDAIQYALKHTNADPEDVHIIGVSGGGFATLAAYMNINYPVKSFSAWAPISDIEAWYWESVGRNQKYANDILKATSSEKTLNKEEAIRRSPLKQAFPKEKRKDAQLFIYEGIHDGYTGSVPITHSILMYNRLVGELKYDTPELDNISLKAETDSELVSNTEIIKLVTKRINPQLNPKEKLFGRNVHLSRHYKNIHLTIFEGGHEQLPEALGLIPYNKVTKLKYDILTIGDSNGSIKGGWVEQLKNMLPESNIVNNSRSGRAIGFDNNGRNDLNALSNIDEYLNNAKQNIGKKKFDYIIICLGTNDTKKMFADRQKEVITNFEALLNKIKKHPLCKKTKLIFVTPPPIRSKNIQEKFQGGNERLNLLVPQMEALATQKGFKVIDIYHPLLQVLDYYAKDGVHMTGAGQEIIASKIIETIIQ